MKYTERRETETIAYDKGFYTDNGTYELCHHTGYEVYDTENQIWWNEYEDSTGTLHYGN